MDVGKVFGGARVLVTGSSGFVGRYVVTRLLDLGAQVYGIDRWKSHSYDGYPSVSEDTGTGYVRISANVRDISSLGMAFRKSEPQYVIHLAAQSYVPESFMNPVNTIDTNALGTAKLLEAARQTDSDAKIVYAGSSEEYGLVIYSESQLGELTRKYGSIFPPPSRIPEVPMSETNPLRPMSPYAVAKVAGDYLTRNYYHTYGLKTVVSRAFNHEGAGRGDHFVTAQLARQVMELKYGERNHIVIGNVSALRDWSHVMDIVNGYLILLSKGQPGEVYNQGAQRTNSVLGYLLFALDKAGLKPEQLSTVAQAKIVDDPFDVRETAHFGLRYQTTRIDRMILNDEISFSLQDEGLIIRTNSAPVKVVFDADRFRPSEVPILLSDCRKIRALGYETQYGLSDIVDDQLNYYLSAERRTHAPNGAVATDSAQEGKPRGGSLPERNND